MRHFYFDLESWYKVDALETFRKDPAKSCRPTPVTHRVKLHESAVAPLRAKLGDLLQKTSLLTKTLPKLVLLVSDYYLARLENQPATILL